MLRIYLPLLLLLLCFGACNNNQREQALKQREAALQQREQQIETREKELDLKEAAVAASSRTADSTAQLDTMYTAPLNLTGTWKVQMTCTEATCAGSAVGDVKTEQWQLSNEANRLVVRATTKGQLVRVYTGTYQNGIIDLTEERASAADPGLAQMVVRLKPMGDNRMEGQREIIRDNNCRIVYALQLDALKK